MTYNLSSYQHRTKGTKIANNNMNYVLIGSRGLGIHNSESDYNYLLVIPENDIDRVLEVHCDDQIIYTTYGSSPVYRIWGKNSQLGAVYDILVIVRPDGTCKDVFFLHNPFVHSIFRIMNLSSDISAHLGLRWKALKQWAKKNKIYGYPYPNGIAYLIYTINSLEKGYSLKEAKNMIYNRCLYQHDEYGSYHVDYIADKALNRMKHIEHEKDDSSLIRYKISSQCIPLILMYSAQFIDSIDAIDHIDPDGIIYAKEDISLWKSEANAWKEHFSKNGTDFRIM